MALYIHRSSGLAVCLSVALLFLASTACVDESAPGGGGAVLPAECGDSPTDCTRLSFVPAVAEQPGQPRVTTKHVAIIGYGKTESLAVRYTNKAGQAIPNGTVTWTLVPKPGRDVAGSAILSSTSKTDGTGVATVDVRTGTGDTDFFVKAEAEGDIPIQYSVSVAQKGDGDMLVKVRYVDGVYGPQARAFRETKVYVFEQGTGAGKLASCEDGFDPYDPAGTLPFPAKQSLTLGALPNEGAVTGLATGQTFTVLAFGQKVEASGSIGLAWACWKGDPNNPEHTIRPAAAIQVDLALKDLTPKYAGKYIVTSEFDFLAMAPDNVEVWIRAIGNLFVNPGQQILLWLENVEAVADFMNTVGPFRGAIEGVLTDIINGLLDFAPDVVGDIRTGVIDVFNIVTSLDIISEVELDSEPAPASDASRAGVLEFPRCSLGEEGAEGHPEGKCPQTEAWVKVGFDWRNSPICEGSQDPRCGYREYGFEAYNLDVVNAEFNAYTTNFWQLTVEPHSVNLDWGILVLFVLEQIALPMIFDADVDSIEDLLFILVGGRDCIANAGPDGPAEACCTAFADRPAIADNGNTVQSAARSLCKQGLPVVVDQLRDQLIGQTVNSGDGFVLGTSDAFAAELVPEGVTPASCTLHDTDPKDLVVDQWGTEGNRCSWIGYVESDTVDPVEASFYGVRD